MAKTKKPFQLKKPHQIYNIEAEAKTVKKKEDRVMTLVELTREELKKKAYYRESVKAGKKIDNLESGKVSNSESGKDEKKVKKKSF